MRWQRIDAGDRCMQLKTRNISGGEMDTCQHLVHRTGPDEKMDAEFSGMNSHRMCLGQE